MNILKKNKRHKKHLENLRRLEIMLTALAIVSGGLLVTVKIYSAKQQPVKSVNAALQEPVTTETDETEKNIPEFLTEPVTEATTEKIDPLNPQFSIEAGFYENPVLLELSSPSSTATIYYTTDSSTPTTDSTIYTQPILLQNRTQEENKIASRSNFRPAKK